MSAELKPIHPEVMYAERSSTDEPEKNVIYFTISAPDINGEPQLDIKPQSISFSAKAGDASKGVPEKAYKFDMDLFEGIIPEETKKMVTSRAVVLVLRKKELKHEYWTRLTKEKPNRNFVKCDFSKWVDEDEQEGAPEEDTSGMGGMGGGGGGGMDMASMMGGMGGGGGMPGMGGMGGAGGMDLASMMGGMGGGGGMPGGMDFSKMMEQMGGAGGMPDFGGDDDGSDGEDAEDEAEAGGEAVADKGKGKAEESKLEDVE